MIRRPPRSTRTDTLFPYTTLFRSSDDVVAANPPYWRLLAHLPPESPYRCEYESKIPAHAKADLLYAYLQRSVDIVAPGGRIGLVTADRWLLNSGSAELREKIGAKYSVLEIKRLESNSALYRPKNRTKGRIGRASERERVCQYV